MRRHPLVLSAQVRKSGMLPFFWNTKWWMYFLTFFIFQYHKVQVKCNTVHMWWVCVSVFVLRMCVCVCVCVCVQFSSVTQSCLTLCYPMNCSTPGLPVHHQPRVYPNSCPLSWWCHPAISSSVFPFSSCLQSFPVSGSFQMSQFFTSGCQSIGVSASASVFPMNIQDWFPLGWSGCISLQSKGLSRLFSNNTVQKHQFFPTQISL